MLCTGLRERLALVNYETFLINSLDMRDCSGSVFSFQALVVLARSLARQFVVYCIAVFLFSFFVVVVVFLFFLALCVCVCVCVFFFRFFSYL